MDNQGKRCNFINIQLSHHVPCENASVSRIRTGFEKVIAHRTNEMFSCVAKMDGVVIAVDDKLKIVKIQYDEPPVKPKGKVILTLTPEETLRRIKANLPIYIVRSVADAHRYVSGDIFEVAKDTYLRVGDIAKLNSIDECPIKDQIPEDQLKKFKEEKDGVLYIRLDSLFLDPRKRIDVFRFGTRMSSVSGSWLVQKIVLNVHEGEKIKRGDIIAYNSGFFEPDPFSKQVSWKHGVQTNVVFMESDRTIEDSNAITPSFSKRLNMQPAHERILEFTNETAVHRMVEIGAEVQTTDILCVVEDGDISSFLDQGDDATTSLLAELNQKSLKARFHGHVAEIDVFYSCSIDSMQPSMQEIVKKIVARKNKISHMASDSHKAYEYPKSSQLAPGTKFRGVNFEDNTIIFTVMIVEDIAHGIGDKLVLGNANKSVSAEVLERDIYSESKVPIDMIFGGMSIMGRIVSAPFYIGAGNRILEAAEKSITDEYFSD